MTRRWHNLLDSFAYLSEQDIRWLEKSRVTVDIAEFPRSCGRMILATIGIALLIPIGFALVGGEIWSSVYIATHMTTPILGVPMGIAIGMLAFATFRLFIQTLKAIIRLQKCYLFLLYDTGINSANNNENPRPTKNNINKENTSRNITSIKRPNLRLDCIIHTINNNQNSRNNNKVFYGESEHFYHNTKEPKLRNYSTKEKSWLNCLDSRSRIVAICENAFSTVQRLQELALCCCPCCPTSKRVAR